MNELIVGYTVSQKSSNEFDLEALPATAARGQGPRSIPVTGSQSDLRSALLYDADRRRLSVYLSVCLSILRSHTPPRLRPDITGVPLSPHPPTRGR